MSLKRSSTTQPGNMTFSRDGPDEQQAEAVHHQQGGRNPAHVQAEAVRRLLDGRQAEAVHQQGGRNQAQAEAVRRLLDGRQAEGVRHDQEDDRSRTRAEGVLHPCGAQGLAANPQRGMPLPGNVRGVQHGGQQRAEAVRYLQDTAGGHSSLVRPRRVGSALNGAHLLSKPRAQASFELL